jgi:hypothetical protein
MMRERIFGSSGEGIPGFLFEDLFDLGTFLRLGIVDGKFT